MESKDSERKIKYEVEQQGCGFRQLCSCSSTQILIYYCSDICLTTEIEIPNKTRNPIYTTYGRTIFLKSHINPILFGYNIKQRTLKKIPFSTLDYSPLLPDNRIENDISLGSQDVMFNIILKFSQAWFLQ